MSIVQSVLIDRNKFSAIKAIDWAKKHNYKISDVDVTDQYYRFRQREPSKKYRYRTHEITDGIKLILGYLK